ncbi:hypothetical protein IM511_00335 [Erythrobacteraceae bacterium E2-1 Yellow Sea]|nr:hypothetical protein [Erythrobacteraceae bacterium E2-1 Yellow Sea]
MFIGHFAPALAAAAISPRAPKLGTLFVAAQLVDWAFFTLAIIGIEKMRLVPGITVMVPFDLYHMPYTHSLLGTAVAAIIFGLIVLSWLRDGAAAILAGMVVISHWLLDFLVHRPDLTLAGSPPKLGLGLWNYPWLEIPLELGITLLAFYWYMRRTRGPVGPALILLVLLLVMQAVNWFGPAPQVAGLALYLSAMAAFAVATIFARWVGTTRWHKRSRG